MSIEQELVTYIRKELASKHPDIDAETNLEGIIDSTAVMELVLWIENRCRFELDIDDITAENFANVKAICAYVASKSKHVA